MVRNEYTSITITMSTNTVKELNQYMLENGIDNRSQFIDDVVTRFIKLNKGEGAKPVKYTKEYDSDAEIDILKNCIRKSGSTNSRFDILQEFQKYEKIDHEKVFLKAINEYEIRYVPEFDALHVNRDEINRRASRDRHPRPRDMNDFPFDFGGD